MAIGTRAEWAVRTPFCLMGVLGILAVYLVTARFVSRRAGVLAAVVLATSPMYSLVARQAMTDMAFVGPMAMALALGALALFDDEDRVLPRRGKGRWSWPHDGLFYFTLGLFALVTLPQLIIDSIQLKIDIPMGGGYLRVYGIVYMIPYFVGFALFVFLAARTRYKAPLYLYIAAILCGLSVLAKGLAGLGLPLVVFLAYLTFTWNWRRLRRAQLVYGVVVSLVALLVVAVPWHHAMIARHGLAFWNELFGDNHWRRMVLGRHGDRGTFEYFIRELGYALWPWVALAPAAVAWAVMRRQRPRGVAATDAEARAQGIFWLGAIWFVSAYAIVSLSMTKFHHYVLPAVPGLAICIGCFLDDLLRAHSRRRIALVALIGLPLLAVTTVDLVDARNASQRFLWLFSYDYIHNPQGTPLARRRWTSLYLWWSSRGCSRAPRCCCCSGRAAAGGRPPGWPWSRWRRRSSCSTTSCDRWRRSGRRRRSSPLTTRRAGHPPSASSRTSCTGAARPSTRRTRSTRGPWRSGPSSTRRGPMRSSTSTSTVTGAGASSSSARRVRRAASRRPFRPRRARRCA